MRLGRIVSFVSLCLLASVTAFGASYRGRRVDGRWYEGRIVNSDFGAYDCTVRFHDDRASVKLSNLGVQLEGFMEDEAIADPREITLYDPLRGVYWTLTVFNLNT